MIERARIWLQGKKAYLTAAIGALGAVAAFADGQIDAVALAGALWAAAQTAFIRAGIGNEIKKQAQE